MAKPRVFVSSTYYDLKHIRASLDLFIDSLGFESVLSEKGDIAYTPDRPLDESCYREAETADIFVLIVGGRYGSEASGTSRRLPLNFFDRYESITKKEYESAASRDIPIYILVEKGVYSEYQTFLRNKDNKAINYAHVESVNVFLLIEDILARPRNNPVHTFERFEEIQTWLRDQWAGFFRELLRRQSQQQQLAGLTTQVAELKEVNETLKTYLEAVMKGAGQEETSKLIESEERRLEDIRRQERLRANRWSQYMERSHSVEFDTFQRILGEATSTEDFALRAAEVSGKEESAKRILFTLETSTAARRDFNNARRTLGLSPLATESSDDENFNIRLRDRSLVEAEDPPPANVEQQDVTSARKTPPAVKRKIVRKAGGS